MAESAPTTQVIPGRSHEGERQIRFDSEILRSLVADEAHVAESGEARAIINRSRGVYGVVSGENHKDNAYGDKAVKAASRSLERHLAYQFNPEQPENSLREAFHTANGRVQNAARRLLGRDRQIAGAAAVVRPFVDESGNIRAAYGAVGDCRIYRWSGDDLEVLVRGTRTAKGRPTHRLTRMEGYTGAPTVGVANVRPNDRFIIVSEGIIEDVTVDNEGNFTGMRTMPEDELRAALRQTNPKAAAEHLVARSQTDADRAAVVLDVPSDEKLRDFAERRGSHAAGAAADVGSAAVAGAAGDRDDGRRNSWRRLRDAAQTGYYNTMYAGRGSHASGQGHGHSTGSDHRNTDRDRNLAKVQKGLLTVAGVLGAVAIGWGLRKAGMDVVPTNIPLIGGDGDAIDYGWWHGDTPHHRYPNNPADGWLGGFLDDDPALPAAEAGTADGGAAAGGSEDPGDGAGTGTGAGGSIGTGEQNPGGAWQLPSEARTVQTGDGMEDLIHRWGHQVVGPEFDGADAHRFYEAIPQDRFGTDFLQFADGSDATYIMPNGEIGLRGPGEIKITDENIRRFFFELMREQAAAAR
ncbi:MAG TPA: hypothetical protein VK978_04535 [Candidatus Saccharimonadales bacterium]|nr:hypothetical protein [Candidatus Saccharimonadales bacterium]